MTTETEAAFAELLDEVGATHDAHGRAAGRRPGHPARGAQVDPLHPPGRGRRHLWADTARPRFVEIVGPYKKWGGDNADAFYCYAPIDPARTYRVTIEPGDAVYLSIDRLRRARTTAGIPSASWARPTAAMPVGAKGVLPPRGVARAADGARRGLDTARARRGGGHHARLPRGPGERATGEVAH